MDPCHAAKFLEPRILCLSAAAAAPSVGHFGRGAVPTLYNLIGVQSDLLEETCSSPSPSPSSNPSKRDCSFSELCKTLRTIEFTPDGAVLNRTGLALAPDTTTTVAHFVRAVVSLSLTSPHAFSLLQDLVESQVDHTFASAYEPNTLISLFLRKTVVALHSIGFEAYPRLLNQLEDYVSGNSDAGAVTSSMSPFVAARVAKQMALGVPPSPQEHLRITTTSTTTGSVLSEDSIEQNGMSSMSTSMMSMTGSMPLPYVPAHVGSTVAQTTVQLTTHLDSIRRRDATLTFDALHRYFDHAYYLFPSLVSVSGGNPSSLSYLTSMASNTNNSNNGNGNSSNPLNSSNNSNKSNHDPNSEHSYAHYHHHAALALAAAHAYAGASRNASSALSDALRTSSSHSDARVLLWIARLEPRIARRHALLSSLRDALSSDLFQTMFTPVSDSCPHISQSNNNSNSNRNNRLNLIPVLGKASGPSDKTCEMLLLTAAVRREAGDVYSALANAQLARKFANSNKYINEAMKMQAMIATALCMSECGDGEAGREILREEINRARLKHHGHKGRKDSNGECSDGLGPEGENGIRTLYWLELERAVRGGDARGAARYARALQALSKIDWGDGDAELDGLEASVLVLASGCGVGSRCVEYHSTADKLYRRCAVRMRPGRAVHALKYVTGSETARVSLARGLGLRAEYVEACVALASSGKVGAGQGLRLMNKVLGEGVRGCGMEVHGKALYTWVECKLKVDDGADGEDGEMMRGRVTKALGLLVKCEDLKGIVRCWYLLARIHDMRGEYALRNRAAKKVNLALRIIRMREL